MSVKCKPIQSTPTLSASDSKRIIAQAIKVPSKESVERNEKLLSLRKQISK